MEISIAFKKQLYINNEPCSLCFRYNQTRYDFSTTFTIKKHEYTTSEFYNINDLKDYLTQTPADLKNAVDEFLQEIPNTLTYDEDLKTIRVDKYLDYLYIEEWLDTTHFEGIYYKTMKEVEFKCEYNMPTLSVRENSLTVLDEKINEFESEVLINCNKVKTCNLLIIKELIKTLFELNIKKG